MPKAKLLFTAPLDFSERVWRKYQDTFETVKWTDFKAEAWVCDPKQTFVIDEHVLSDFPYLKILATPSTGSNHIDLAACARRGVEVISLLDNRPGLEKISASAEFTFKLLLEALRLPPARELQGKRVGMVGYGRIGRKMNKWCQAFGARTFFHDPRLNEKSKPIEWIFSKCHAVIICATYDATTHGLVTKALLASMKHGAALVNTARGEILDEDGLVEVMKERPDLRVALDVLVGETTGAHNPQRLKELGAICTPHIAGETSDSRTKAAQIIYDLLVERLNREDKTVETAELQ